MKTVALIPARGGSKSIPRKNVRWLAGMPLIAHTIKQAQQSQSVNRILVSTDDAEIADVSRQYGAEVIWRPSEISGDKASSESALLHALEYLQDTETYVPDIVVFLQCTSPLTLAEDIDGTVETLLEQKADTALAVTSFHYFLWQNHDEPKGAIGINHDKTIRLLRQDRIPQYLETGAVYAMKAKGFVQAQHRFFGKTVIHEMPPERCLEIDEPVDFKLAEVLLRERERNRKIQALPVPVNALVLDFDGVFTDNRVLVSEEGKEAVLCHRGDGWGLANLKTTGIPVVVISTEENPVVKARCDKLDIPCLQGIRDKLSMLKIWTESQSISLAHTVYVGNDVNDLSCLRAVGCGIVVSDAHPDVLSSARIILDNAGGVGAIRELTDMIITKSRSS